MPGQVSQDQDWATAGKWVRASLRLMDGGGAGVAGQVGVRSGSRV